MRRKEHKKSRKRKLFLSGIGFILLIFLITSFFGEKGLIEIYQLRKEYKTLQKEIEALKREKEILEREIIKLKNNPEAIEGEARLKLWLMKSDEKMIVIKKK
ncbi:MAG: septum formation initiator family protein [Candidatus Aminicenantia bacterium]